MNTTPNILQTPYEQLPISSSLKRFFAVHGIPNLEKLLEIEPKVLLEMKWFSVRLWREVIVLVEEK